MEFDPNMTNDEFIQLVAERRKGKQVVYLLFDGNCYVRGVYKTEEAAIRVAEENGWDVDDFTVNE